MRTAPIILIVGLLLIHQMAGAKKNETTVALKNDSAFSTMAGNEPDLVYNNSTAERKVFSELPIIHFEKAVESPLKLEEWMLKDWMPVVKYSESLHHTEKEEEMELECWMIDELYWTNNN
jgi:hypothetical protein